jgi:hypothetical protein
MINIKPQILALLKTIPSVEVTYFFPESFAVLPAISYYELSNTTAQKSDGLEYLSEIHIQVDAWAKTSSGTSDLAVKIDDLMISKGFYREMAMDLYEQVTKIHHKTMRYKGVINNKTFQITK